MARIARLITRLVPPLLMAAGVTLVAVGLLSYATTPNAAAVPSPTDANLPSPSVLIEITPSPGPATPSPTTPSGPSPSASATVEPSPSASLAPAAAVTRVVMESLDIDLPVISRLQTVPGQGPDLYPPCDVAIDHDAFPLPAEEGTTYIYAHAQDGMFLPLLVASHQDNGTAMLGSLIEVYTADDKLWVYAVDTVKRHALDFSITDTTPGEHRVVLQTSEGPFGTTLKLQVAGHLISQITASNADAHPKPKPRACYPG